MEAKITRIDAEQAIREGTTTAKQRKQIEDLQARLEAMQRELMITKARLTIARRSIERNNSIIIQKHEGIREAREAERKEARGNVIDALIVGVMVGMMLTAVIAWFVVAMG